MDKHYLDYPFNPVLNLSTVDENVLLYHRMIESMKFAYAARSKMGDLSFGADNLTVVLSSLINDLHWCFLSYSYNKLKWIASNKKAPKKIEIILLLIERFDPNEY